jgi:hypothetical protein
MVLLLLLLLWCACTWFLAVSAAACCRHGAELLLQGKRSQVSRLKAPVMQKIDKRRVMQ